MPLVFSCSGTGPGNAPATVEQAEAQLAKKKRKEVKAANKALKAKKKAYWKMQSPAARESIKRNEKRQRKMARAARRR